MQNITTPDHNASSKVQRKIDIATVVDRVNKRITIPFTLEIRPCTGTSNFNATQAHCHFFHGTITHQTNSTIFRSDKHYN